MTDKLTREQKFILFEEGTEPPGSSSLNNEKRNGSYHCVGCGAKLFIACSHSMLVQPDSGFNIIILLTAPIGLIKLIMYIYPQNPEVSIF